MISIATDFEQDIWYKASPIALFFFVGKTIRKGFEQFKNVVLPNSFVLAWFLAQRNWLLIGVLVAIWVILIFSVAFIRYWRFRFKLASNNISVREGVLKERRLDLDFERIRAVNYNRGLVDRMLGLTGISFDTAGTGEAEATIPAVSMRFAESLRASIEERRSEDTKSQTSSGLTSDQSEGVIIPTFKWPQILRIGFCSGNFVLVATLFALVPSVMSQYSTTTNSSDGEANSGMYGSAFDWVYRHWKQVHSPFFSDIGWHLEVVVILVEVILALLLVTILFNVAGAIFRWHNFTLFRDNNSLRSVSGLTTVRETRITLPKIQSVSVTENLRSRWFSFFKFTAKQSHSQQEHSLVVPLTSSAESFRLCHLMFKDAVNGLRFNPRDREFIPISPAYFWVGFVNAGVIPGLLAIVIGLVLFKSPIVLLVLAWPAIVAMTQFLKWRKAGYMYNEQALVHRKGVLTYTLVTMPFSKIQSVSVVQNLIQHWTQRATLEIKNSTHSFGIPYLDIDLAREFRDFLLYTIESSSEEWQ